MNKPPRRSPAGLVPQHSSRSLLSKGPRGQGQQMTLGNQRLCLVGQPHPPGAWEGTPKGLSGLLAEPQWPCPSPRKGRRCYFSRGAAPPPTPTPQALCPQASLSPSEGDFATLGKENRRGWKKESGARRQKKKLAHSSHKGRRERARTSKQAAVPQ